MAKLRFLSKETLGEYIISAAQDPNERIELQKPEHALEMLSKHLDIPAGDTVVIHFDQEHIHHFILPLASDIKTLVDAVNNHESPYPGDYVPEPLVNISIAREPIRALNFRVGEYTMARCKT